MSLGWLQHVKASNRRRKRRRLAQKFPSSLADLVKIAQASTVEVKKLPDGVPLNWRPSWLQQRDLVVYEKQTDDVPIPEPHIHVADLASYK